MITVTQTIFETSNFKGSYYYSSVIEEVVLVQQ